MKGEKVEIVRRRGDGVADSNIASDGCAGEREGRNTILI